MALSSLRAPRTHRTQYPHPKNAWTSLNQTKNGVLVYEGDARTFMEWKFRTQLKYDNTEGKDDDETKRIRKQLTTTIVEGLKGAALQVATDMKENKELGDHDAIPKLIQKMEDYIFPHKATEAQQLFAEGQNPHGILRRQPGEAMFAYINRRERWYYKVKELDPKTEISENLRTEWMMKQSGLNENQLLMIKTSIQNETGDWKLVKEAMLKQHPDIHLKDGYRKPTKGKGKGSRKGKGKGFRRSNFGSGKSRFGSSNQTYRAAIHMGITDTNDSDRYWNGNDEDLDATAEWIDSDEYEGYTYAAQCELSDEDYEGYDPEGEYYEEGESSDNGQTYHTHDGGENYGEAEEEPEYHKNEEEWIEHRAYSLTGYECDSDGQAEVIADSAQQELAAFYGRSFLGKGKSTFGQHKKQWKVHKMPRKRPKGKGKFRAYTLAIDDRRKRIEALKAKTKCRACGQTGHWMNDKKCERYGKKSFQKRQARVSFANALISQQLVMDTCYCIDFNCKKKHEDSLEKRMKMYKYYTDNQDQMPHAHTASSSSSFMPEGWKGNRGASFEEPARQATYTKLRKGLVLDESSDDTAQSDGDYYAHVATGSRSSYEPSRAFTGVRATKEEIEERKAKLKLFDGHGDAKYTQKIVFGQYQTVVRKDVLQDTSFWTYLLWMEDTCHKEGGGPKLRDELLWWYRMVSMDRKTGLVYARNNEESTKASERQNTIRRHWLHVEGVHTEDIIRMIVMEEIHYAKTGTTSDTTRMTGPNASDTSTGRAPPGRKKKEVPKEEEGNEPRCTEGCRYGEKPIHGSNTHAVRYKCLDCGHIKSESAKRTQDPMTCKHINTDTVGSTTDFVRIRCKDCHTIIDGRSRTEHERRTFVSNKVKDQEPNVVFDGVEKMIKQKTQMLNKEQYRLFHQLLNSSMDRYFLEYESITATQVISKVQDCLDTMTEQSTWLYIEEDGEAEAFVGMMNGRHNGRSSWEAHAEEEHTESSDNDGTENTEPDWNAANGRQQEDDLSSVSTEDQFAFTPITTERGLANGTIQRLVWRDGAFRFDNEVPVQHIFIEDDFPDAEEIRRQLRENEAIDEMDPEAVHIPYRQQEQDYSSEAGQGPGESSIQSEAEQLYESHSVSSESDWREFNRSKEVPPIDEEVIQDILRGERNIQLHLPEDRSQELREGHHDALSSSSSTDSSASTQHIFPKPSKELFPVTREEIEDIDPDEPPVRFNQIQIYQLMKEFTVCTATKRELSESHSSTYTGNLRKKMKEIAHNLPVVDIWNDLDVWAMIDDGANRTVHGKEWMDNTLRKLDRFGLTAPWKDHTHSRIKGIGEATYSTGTRQLPVSFGLLDIDTPTDAAFADEHLPGLISTKELPGDTPLLISDRLQRMMKLVKDMDTSQYTLKDYRGYKLRLCRGKGTDLIHVNISSFVLPHEGYRVWEWHIPCLKANYRHLVVQEFNRRDEGYDYESDYDEDEVIDPIDTDAIWPMEFDPTEMPRMDRDERSPSPYVRMAKGDSPEYESAESDSCEGRQHWRRRSPDSDEDMERSEDGTRLPWCIEGWSLPPPAKRDWEPEEWPNNKIYSMLHDIDEKNEATMEAVNVSAVMRDIMDMTCQRYYKQMILRELDVARTSRDANDIANIVDENQGYDEVCDDFTSNLIARVRNVRFGGTWVVDDRFDTLFKPMDERVEGNSRIPYDRNTNDAYEDLPHGWRDRNIAMNIFRRRIKIISFGVCNLHELDGADGSKINLNRLVEEMDMDAPLGTKIHRAFARGTGYSDQLKQCLIETWPNLAGFDSNQRDDNPIVQKLTSTQRDFHRMFTFDCLNLHDPHHDMEMRGHVGTHARGFLAQTRTESFTRLFGNLQRQLESFLEGQAMSKCDEEDEWDKPLIIAFYCKKGRHRSQIMAEIVRECFVGMGFISKDSKEFSTTEYPANFRREGHKNKKQQMEGQWHNLEIEHLSQEGGLWSGMCQTPKENGPGTQMCGLCEWEANRATESGKEDIKNARIRMNDLVQHWCENSKLHKHYRVHAMNEDWDYSHLIQKVLKQTNHSAEGYREILGRRSLRMEHMDVICNTVLDPQMAVFSDLKMTPLDRLINEQMPRGYERLDGNSIANDSMSQPIYPITQATNSQLQSICSVLPATPDPRRERRPAAAAAAAPTPRYGLNTKEIKYFDWLRRHPVYKWDQDDMNWAEWYATKDEEWRKELVVKKEQGVKDAASYARHEKTIAWADEQIKAGLDPAIKEEREKRAREIEKAEKSKIDEKKRRTDAEKQQLQDDIARQDAHKSAASKARPKPASAPDTRVIDWRRQVMNLSQERFIQQTAVVDSEQAMFKSEGTFSDRLSTWDHYILKRIQGSKDCYDHEDDNVILDYTKINRRLEELNLQDDQLSRTWLKDVFNAMQHRPEILERCFSGKTDVFFDDSASTEEMELALRCLFCHSYASEATIELCMIQATRSKPFDYLYKNTPISVIAPPKYEPPVSEADLRKQQIVEEMAKMQAELESIEAGKKPPAPAPMDVDPGQRKVMLQEEKPDKWKEMPPPPRPPRERSVPRSHYRDIRLSAGSSSGHDKGKGKDKDKDKQKNDDWARYDIGDIPADYHNSNYQRSTFKLPPLEMDRRRLQMIPEGQKALTEIIEIFESKVQNSGNVCYWPPKAKHQSRLDQKDKIRAVVYNNPSEQDLRRFDLSSKYQVEKDFKMAIYVDYVGGPNPDWTQHCSSVPITQRFRAEEFERPLARIIAVQYTDDPDMPLHSAMTERGSHRREPSRHERSRTTHRREGDDRYTYESRWKQSDEDRDDQRPRPPRRDDRPDDRQEEERTNKGQGKKQHTAMHVRTDDPLNIDLREEMILCSKVMSQGQEKAFSNGQSEVNMLDTSIWTCLKAVEKS